MPERLGLYIPNEDGTFSYDLKKVKEMTPYNLESGTHVPKTPSVIKDNITGNGGMVSSKYTSFGRGVGEDSNKEFGVLHLSDLWDV